MAETDVPAAAGGAAEPDDDAADAAAAAVEAAGAAPAAPRVADAMSARDALDAWDKLRVQAVNLLQHDEPDAAWAQRLAQLADALCRLGLRYPDLGLYYLLNEKINLPTHYSATHAMACALVARLLAGWLEWDDAAAARAACAAFSMNVGMTRLQDQLAVQDGALSDTQREQIGDHATRGAQLLEQAGIDDEVWVQAVRSHHAPQPGDDDAQRLAALLQRVDVYVAKLSRRRTRSGLTPALAARAACVGAGGKPDELGAALLRVVGLYPPGSYVELANGELGVVVRRGERAHEPRVAVLRRADGAYVSPPKPRDTALNAFAVRRGVGPDRVRARHGHVEVLRAAG
ncbi:hypothetical protein GALL_365840 [mine drainage metagenome]|jgi:HD-GYP domain-containing protein (c-di-GMP phosphodiesterase class II)|uniref:Phosphohydrolase n=1 Tax=mine drainage metagenome TaxID=410659 RepID=A0A1J5R0F8_9ZZZZ